MAAYEQSLAQERRRLIYARVRAGVALNLLAAATLFVSRYAIAAAPSREESLIWVYLVYSLAMYVAARTELARERPIGLAMLYTAGWLVLVGYFLVTSGNGTAACAFLGIGFLATAGTTFWGAGPQLIHVATGFAVLGIATELAPAAALEIDATTLRAAIMAGVLSTAIAHQIRRSFDATLAESLGLARAQGRIRELNENLEETVDKRTTELQIAVDDQQIFNYAVSHDLRQPLRHVAGYIRMVEDSAGERHTDEERDFLRRSHSAVVRMGEMVDALLQLSRVSGLIEDREPVDMTALVEQAIRRYQRAEPLRFVVCQVAPGIRVQGDELLLGLLADRLVSNAWKFTRTLDRGEIEFGTAGDGVYFVKDNGVGFDGAHSEKMFAPFQRLHGADEFEGEGMGLAMVARVVRYHGGRLWAESEVGSGATIFFTLGQDGGARADGLEAPSEVA